MREAIIFNRKNGKRVHIALIDASKAFDKINRLYLWHKLINKIVPVILLSLMNYYEESLAYVDNKGKISTAKI